MAKKAEERRRLQVAVSAELLDELKKLAKLEDREVPWLCGHLINMSLNSQGIKSFSQWLAARIVAKPKKAAAFRQTGAKEKSRIHVVVNETMSQKLEDIADRMDCTVLKLAGLFLDHGVDAHGIWFKIFNTAPGSLVRRLLNGVEEADPSSEEIPISWDQLSWNKDED